MSSGTRETLPDFSRGFVYIPYHFELGWIAMGIPNSHQHLELWDVHTSRSGIEALPKHKIEGSYRISTIVWVHRRLL
jgi:hypothetical protein